MVRKKNKNIVILKNIEQLVTEIDFEDFSYKKDFELICNLLPNKEKECLEIEDKSQKIDNTGLVYVFVIQGKIFKIGHTITSIKKRVQSYNCGNIEYRISGTNYTTNYFVLQSLLAIKEKIAVYAFFPKQPKYELFGKVYQDSYPLSKRAENTILNDLKEKYKKLPIGCTQK